MLETASLSSAKLDLMLVVSSSLAMVIDDEESLGYGRKGLAIFVRYEERIPSAMVAIIENIVPQIFLLFIEAKEEIRPTTIIKTSTIVITSLSQYAILYHIEF